MHLAWDDLLSNPGASMRSIRTVATCGLLACALSGCAASVPKCGDEETIALVKDIVAKLIGASEAATLEEVKAELTVNLPRATAYSEAIKKYDCEAQLVASGAYQLPIAYESQINDSGQHLVTVGDLSELGLFRAVDVLLNRITDARIQAEKSRIAAAAVRAAPPSPPPPQARPAAAEGLKAPSRIQQAGALNTELAKGPATVEVPAAVRSFMDKSYGQYSAKHSCWRTEFESQGYCVQVLKMDRISADTGERFYLLVGGHPIDEEGEPAYSHASPGLVGAFVFAIGQEGTELTASNMGMYAGSSGVVPERWDLVKLARTDYYGWQTTWGDCHQGYCGSRLMLLAPYGRSIKDVAAFTISFSNTGACESGYCSDGESSVDSTVVIDANAEGSDIHPLVVSFKGTLDGQDLNGTARRLEFDRDAWQYAVPEDWPLADVEY